MPKDHDGFLTISEVQVFSAGVNIARTGKGLIQYWLQLASE